MKNTRQVASTLKTLMLKPNDWVPNNRRLPVIIYESAISVTGNDPAALFEKIFSANGWPPQWRDGVYDYHHYHTEGHEVLGVVSGQARLMLGGPDGQVVEVKKGDVLLLILTMALKNGEILRPFGLYATGVTCRLPSKSKRVDSWYLSWMK